MGSVLDELVECDRHNSSEARRILREFDPRAIEAVEEFARLLVAAGDAFGEVSGYDKHNLSLNDWLQKQSGSARELVRFLEQATFLGEPTGEDPISTAKSDLAKANSAIARTYLILRIRRDFLLGLADLLKLRLTPALGYLRLQSESTAILAMIASNPSMSIDWLNPYSGRKFYKSYHAKIVEKMKSLAIHDYYDQGSEMALHSRVHGVVPGLLVNNDAAAAGEVALTYQEFHDPVDFLVWFGIYLRTHQKLLAGVAEGLPEVDLGKLGSGKYNEMVAALTEKLKAVYLKEKYRDEFGPCCDWHITPASTGRPASPSAR